MPADPTTRLDGNPSTTIESHRELLQQLLSRQSHSQRELPTLTEGFSIMERFRDWVSSLDDLVRLWLGNSHMSAGTAELIHSLAYGLIATIIAALLVFLVWRSVTLLSNFLRRKVETTAAEAGINTVASYTLEDLLQEALHTGNWQKAMRERWRVFLSRTELPTHLTPREFVTRSLSLRSTVDTIPTESSSGISTALDGALDNALNTFPPKDFAEKAYANMFSAILASKDHYTSLNQLLQQGEQLRTTPADHGTAVGRREQ